VRIHNCIKRITSVIACVAILVTQFAPSGRLQAQTPNFSSCAPSKLGATSSSVANAVVAGSNFSATFDQSIATNGTTSASLKVWRNSQLSLQADTQIDKQGHLQILVFAGAGFHDVKQVNLQSTDRVTLQGTVDGKAIAPFRIGSQPGSMTLADKTAIVRPAAADPDVKQALPILLQSLPKQCKSSEPPAASGTMGKIHPDVAGQPEGNEYFPGCLACIQLVQATAATCYLAAGVAAAACTFWYPICFAAAVALCATAYYLAMQNNCHDPDVGGAGGGGPCCPVSCGGLKCCAAGEACTAIGDCCQPGFKTCGSNGCCSATDTCIPATGACCPGGQNVCNGVCCPNPNEVCDPTTQACCCAGKCGGATSSCGGTCTACPSGQVCTGQTCCTPNCAGKCGGAPDGCGGTCTSCAAGQVCTGQTCCTPNCAGKCGGAPDGCGGTCTSCAAGQVCDGQACCTPKCGGVRCGASNGCGGICTDGLCPPGETCQDTKIGWLCLPPPPPPGHHPQ
jgi:hypothetical protein